MTVLRHSFVVPLLVCLTLGACDRAAVPSASAPPSPLTPLPTTSPDPGSTQFGSPVPSQSPAPSDEAGGWHTAGHLQEARNATNVVVVGTGDVLVVGSDYQTSWLSACGAATNGSDSVEIGDPSAQTWEKTDSLSAPREAPVVVALRDGQTLMTGGQRGENFEPAAFSSTYVFDPSTRRWSRSGLLNTARSGAAGVALPDGRVLVAGGVFLDAATTPRILDSAELWDPGSGRRSRTGRLAEPRLDASAVALTDGRVLIVGGIARREDAPLEQASAEVYDPLSGQWSSAGTLEAARPGFVLVALADGGALAAGGLGNRGLGERLPVPTVERFDPVSNTWSAAADLPVAVAGAAAVRLADGLVLIAGGSARPPVQIDPDAGTYKSGLIADAAIFDPETGTWLVIAPMPTPRAGASAVLLPDGSAVFAGGSSEEGSPAETPGCPVADPQVVRYAPRA